MAIQTVIAGTTLHRMSRQQRTREKGAGEYVLWQSKRACSRRERQVLGQWLLVLVRDDSAGSRHSLRDRHAEG